MDLRRRAPRTGEERANRSPRGIAHLEATEGFLPNPVEHRLGAWLDLLRREDVLRSPEDNFILMPYSKPMKLILVAGRDTINGCRVFTCTYCPRPTTDRPTKDMRYVWPPPKDWSFAVFKKSMVPHKLRKYVITPLYCPDCASEQSGLEMVNFERFRQFSHNSTTKE